MSRKSLFGWALGLCLIALLVGCSAQAGPAGAAGPAGPAGQQGQAGPAGKDGQSAKSITIPPGPGLKVKIIKVDLTSGDTPVIFLSLTDANGVNLPAATLEGAGFTIAQVYVDMTDQLSRYSSLLVHEVNGLPYQLNGTAQQPVLQKATQAYADSGGTWGEAADGSLTYTFKDKLTTPADLSMTTVVGVYAWKDNRATVGNDVFTFVPAGGEPQVIRQVVSTAACQTCHNPLEAHGGLRRDVNMCVLCHTDQTTDPETGNLLDFKMMVHKLHMGSQLPKASVAPYRVVGFQQNVSDFSKVIFPQDIRNCTTCHQGAPQSDNYKEMPNSGACTSCHETVSVASGENHPGGVKGDGECTACHEPEGGEFDASVVGAHTLPLNSRLIKGLKLEIVSVEGAVAGGSPVVKFKLTDNTGAAVDPATIGYLGLTLAGPTSDYQHRWTEVASSTELKVPSKVKTVDGVNVYQFEAKIPADATGTYAVGMEGYVVPDGPAKVARVAAFNPVAYVSLDANKPVDRRKVVAQEKCNACHQSLSAHDGTRQNLEYCVLCHNPQASDAANRPADQQPAAVISFPVLIHRVHHGGEAAQPLKVYGGEGEVADFSDVVFPGDLAACETCHLANTYKLPLPTGNRPITIQQKDQALLTILPIRAICTSCHDRVETGGHVELQTTSSGIETCLVCHGPNREFDVSATHH